MRQGIPIGASASAAVAVMLLACCPSGCSGSSRPAGGASATGAPGGGVGPGGVQSMRLVGFEVDRVFPATTGFTWLFVTSGGAVSGTSQVFIDGAPIASSLFSQTLTIGAGAQSGVFFSIVTPAIGSLIGVRALDALGSPIFSNALTVKGAPFPAANTPPVFETLVPASGEVNVADRPTFIWTQPEAATELLLCIAPPGAMSFTVSPAIPLAVELTIQAQGNQEFQATQTVAAGAGSVFSNEPLLPFAPYVWSVVAIDPDGWGVGTTIDVAGFSASDAASWPQFRTQ